MEQLKDSEKRVLEYMKEVIDEKGYPPTVREIGDALSIKSTSSVHKTLTQLEKKGYIKKDVAKPRALTLVKQEDEFDLQNDENMNGGRVDVVEIPVVGQIAAGIPILAEQNIEDSFPIPSRFVGRKTNFMLVVKGDSMIEAGIFDGDYILVEEDCEARNGEIVVAMIDGFESEATVKTFYKENNHIRLQPENSTMTPIIVNDVRILGKVRGVFRYF
ncbi:MAG: transcriptional repressor LexA [Eubacteriales bacterium]